MGFRYAMQKLRDNQTGLLVLHNSLYLYTFYCAYVIALAHQSHKHKHVVGCGRQRFLIGPLK